MAQVRVLVLFVSIVLAACNLTQDRRELTPEVSVSAATLQPDLTCDQLITSALERVGPACASLGRNQACYGNTRVEVEFQPGASASFASPGDRMSLLEIRRLTATALDEAAQLWGIALLKAQANLPDTLPGQNVTFLLYGNTSLDNITPEMQAVTLSTGIGEITCESAPPAALLVQSPEGQQVTLNINGASVTLASTLYLTAVQNGQLTVGTIEGIGVVQSFGTSRIVQAGAQVQLPLGTVTGLTVIGPPSLPQPIDLTVIEHAPLQLLDRPVQLPLPVSQPGQATPATPTRTLSPVTDTPEGAACTPRSDWTDSYSVQPGDTLSRIAQRFDLTTAELQAANCITDPNRIRVGLQLRVPFRPATDTPIPTPATPTPTVANFRADSSSLIAGQCTTARWDVDNVSAVYFEGEPTTGHNAQQVCPKETTVYTLLVIHPDGTQVPYTLTIRVAQPPATTETPQLR